MARRMRSGLLTGCGRPLLALALGPLCLPPHYRTLAARMASAPPPRDEAPDAEPRRPEEEDGRGSAALEAELQRAGGRSGGSSLRPGHVYFVATPIGNLDDLTLRAARTLRDADYVASEDTRHTAKLLRHLGVSPAKQLSHHEHNALAASARIIALATEGATVAVVSDAGTPGISDPGAVLAERCAAAGVPLVPIPGACAAVSALSVSGFACTGFRFGGFLPRSGRARKQRLAELVADPNAVVLYEAPHRLVATLSELAAAGAGDRRLVAARELTKLHEELARGSVGGLAAHFGALELQGKLRGEFTLVMAPISEDVCACCTGERRLVWQGAEGWGGREETDAQLLNLPARIVGSSVPPAPPQLNKLHLLPPTPLPCSSTETSAGLCAEHHLGLTPPPSLVSRAQETQPPHP